MKRNHKPLPLQKHPPHILPTPLTLSVGGDINRKTSQLRSVLSGADEDGVRDEVILEKDKRHTDISNNLYVSSGYLNKIYSLIAHVSRIKTSQAAHVDEQW